MQVFHYHIDGVGGGWREVNDVVIGQLGIVERISSRSKHLGNRFFLDQHHDVAIFLNAYRRHYGEPHIVHHTESGESVIRMYPDFFIGRLGPHARRTLRIEPHSIQHGTTPDGSAPMPGPASHI